MSLEVGINSYVTLEEAEDYVISHYMSNSPEFTAWNALSDNDKAVALVTSATALNNAFTYVGKKVIAGQKLAFPRSYTLLPGIVNLPFRSQYFDSTLISSNDTSDGGLDLAKEAQLVNAVSMVTSGAELQSSISKRRFSGIKSESIGSASMSYDDSETSALLKGIYAKDRVEMILRPWISSRVMSW